MRYSNDPAWEHGHGDDDRVRVNDRDLLTYNKDMIFAVQICKFQLYRCLS